MSDQDLLGLNNSLKHASLIMHRRQDNVIMDIPIPPFKRTRDSDPKMQSSPDAAMHIRPERPSKNSHW